MNVRSWLKQNKAFDGAAILAELLDVDQTWLVTHEDDEISPEILHEADLAVLERKNGAPLAIVLNHRDFYGRRFFVNDGRMQALIPRPETEDIIDFIKELKPATVADIGTGSGCIAITLKLELPDTKVLAVDKYDYSALVHKNAEALGAEIEFRNSDLLSAVDEKFDVIVANLPYVDREWSWVNQEALSYEPDAALYANKKGLELIEELIDQVVAKKACKYLILEADPCQHEAIKEYAAKNGLEFVKVQNFVLEFKY